MYSSKMATYCMQLTLNTAALQDSKCAASQLMLPWLRPRRECFCSSFVSIVSWPRYESTVHIEGCPCQSTTLEGASFFNFAEIYFAGFEWLCSRRNALWGRGKGGEDVENTGQALSLRNSIFLHFGTELGTLISHGSRAGSSVVKAQAFA
jgi:hypothetical protein